MKKHIVFFKLLLVLCLSGISTIATASNYYASPSGTGIGTFADPTSLTTGLSKLTVGNPDTLFLFGGIYNQSAKISLTKSGTASARLAIFAIPGDTVIIDFRNQVFGVRGFEVSGNYIHVKGLTIQYAGDNGMHITSNYNIIENCVFHANCDAGFQISGSSSGGVGNVIKNCDSYDNFDYETGGVTAANFGGNADGFADKLYDNTSDVNTYIGCRSWNNSDDGWDMYNRRGITHIINSWCYNLGRASFDLTNNPRVKGIDSTWFKQFPMTVTSDKGSSVTATIAAYPNFGNGNGFKLGGDYRNNIVTLENCLSSSNKAHGFDQNNNAGLMTLHNCTAYNNTPNYAFYDRASNSSSASNPASENPVTNALLDIKNCASLGGTSNTFVSATYLTSSYNTWNTNGVTCTAADFQSIDPTEMITSPRQADGSLPNIAFMHLVPGSDLINAGTNVTLPYSGVAPDLGCFEVGTLDQFPAVVSTPTNSTQSVLQGSAIENIVFTWSGGATGLTVTGLPDGITTTIDPIAKTLTLSGTPTTLGISSYTLTTVGGSGSSISVTREIICSSATAKKIAFFTTPNNTADTKILNKLQANPDFSITVIDATLSSVDYSGYDLIVMSPVPASGSLGYPAIKTLDKPKLLLKPFTLKSTIWHWITASTAVNTTAITDSITNKSHEIFTGLTFTGPNNDELQLFSSVLSQFAVTGVTASTWIATPSVDQLATSVGSNTTQSIVEIPVGTNMNGTTTTQRFLMIGLSEYSIANLTATATQLIENSCYYLLGMSVPVTAIKESKAASQYKIIQTSTNISVDTNEEIKGLELYTITGNKIATSNNKTISTANLAQGVYILHIIGQTKNYYSKILIKK